MNTDNALVKVPAPDPRPDPPNRVHTSSFDPMLAVMRGDESLTATMLYKAQPIGESYPDLCLVATHEIPTPRAHVDPDEHKHIFESDAAAVVSALYASLPGGTLDQILRLMLERKASQFIVRF